MRFDPEKHHRRSIRLQGYDYAQAGAYFITIVTQGRECLFGQVVNDEMQLNDAGRMVWDQWEALARRFPTVELDKFVVMPNHVHGIVQIVGASLVGAPIVGAPDVDAQIVGAPDVDAQIVGAPDVDAQIVGTPDVDARIVGAPDGDAQIVGAPDANAPIVGAPDANAQIVGAPDANAQIVGAPDADAQIVGASLVGAQNGATTPQNGATTRVAPTLGDVVGAFKSTVTHAYIRGVEECGWARFPGRLWQRNYYEHIIRDDVSLNRIRQYIADNPAQWANDDENPDKGHR